MLKIAGKPESSSDKQKSIKERLEQLNMEKENTIQVVHDCFLPFLLRLGIYKDKSLDKFRQELRVKFT